MTSTADQPEIRRPDFLVFSDDWGEHPSSCQHIFRHIAKDHRVLWVNTIGMRNPTLTWADARKVVIKVSKMFGRRRKTATSEEPKNITICQPLMFPGTRSRAVRAFNTKSVTRKVTAMLRALEMESPIIITTVPNTAEYPDLLKNQKLIYYCVDDFSLWPGLESETVREMEDRLIEQSDSIIAVSESLYRRLSTFGKPTYLLTHGVDLEMFSRSAESELPKYKDIPKPRVGFFGLIDGRMNWDLVVPLARKMPETSFVFAGPVDATAGVLPRVENIYFLGPVPYDELPKFIAGVEALILPYRTGELAETLSPLKLKEYMATGLPVVASSISQARSLRGLISVLDTTSEWKSEIEKFRRGAASHKFIEVQNAIKGDSWNLKAESLYSICIANMSGRSKMNADIENSATFATKSSNAQ